MSRHRAVRNIDLDDALRTAKHDELDEELELTPEEEVQMNVSLDRVREVVGPEHESGFTDADIREALWEYYFDVDQTIDWVFAEQTRQHEARERQDPTPPGLTPYDWNGALIRSQAGENPSSAHRLAKARADINAQAHMPLIHIAQGGLPPEGEPSMEEEEPFSPYGNNRLSTITERTEQMTIRSRMTPASSRHTLRAGDSASQQPLTVPGRGSYYAPSRASGRPMSVVTSTTFTDYGQVIDSQPLLNPNDILPSPPMSALSLSEAESTISPGTSESRTPPPTSPEGPLRGIDTMPNILDMGFATGSQVPSQPSTTLRPPSVAPTPRPPSAIPTPTPSPTPSRAKTPVAISARSSVAEEPAPPVPAKKAKSKLSALASSRASTYSQSSHSDTLETSSVITYPALRPSAASALSLRPETVLTTDDAASDTSSIVRRAIQTAMDQEADDVRAAAPPKAASRLSRATSASTIKPPVPPKSERSDAGSNAESSTFQPGRPMSKLAALAQAKAAEQKGPWMPTPKRLTSQNSGPGELLNRQHTQYLAPVANGPTVTTAITTSYQTLSSLTPPSRSGLPSGNYIEPVPTVPLPPSGRQSSESSKLSKLAMKSKRSSQQKSGLMSPGVVEDEPLSPELPVFLPRSSSRSRASPSAFASLLINDDPTTPQGKDGRSSHSGLSRETSDSSAYSRRRSSKHRAPPPGDGLYPASPNMFAFDMPSPDDIVHNARRGTSLAQSITPRSSTPLSSSTASSRPVKATR